MKVVVRKYGGSSVGSVDRIEAVADRVAALRRDDGAAVVVVVSAMQGETDRLLGLASAVATPPPRRELDMLLSTGERTSMALLAMALQARGVPARSLSGSQAGVVTDEQHADARVVEVRPDRLRQVLADGEVAVVGGFQGVSRGREVTTLGRGGSDTTAVVLAAALEAERCEICSDVDGVWSADPRVVPEASRQDALPTEVALALARGGAKVLYEDAVRQARDLGVTIVARTSFGPGAGTRIAVDAPRTEGVVAVASDARLLWVGAGADPSATLTAVAEAGGRVRRRLSDGWLVDARNLHGALAGAEPAATVTAVGSAVGEDGRAAVRGDQALARARVDVLDRGGFGDALWWRIAPGAADGATRALHAALVTR